MKSLKRINITLNPALVGILDDISHKEHQKISDIVQDLIADALERREDLSLSKLAALRDINNKKKISHQEAWQ